MRKHQDKYDHMKARAEWLKLSPKENSDSRGKRRFIVHKNINSALFRSVIKHEPETVVRKKSLPQVIKTSKAMHIPVSKKEAFVQVENDRISCLERELKEKNSQLSILQNLFSCATSRVESKPRPSIHRSNHTLIQEDHASILNSPTKSSFMRHSSLPSLKSQNYLEYSNHPAFVQPKFTKNHPKIILTNPITGLPYPF